MERPNVGLFLFFLIISLSQNCFVHFSSTSNALTANTSVSGNAFSVLVQNADSFWTPNWDCLSCYEELSTFFRKLIITNLTILLSQIAWHTRYETTEITVHSVYNKTHGYDLIKKCWVTSTFSTQAVFWTAIWNAKEREQQMYSFEFSEIPGCMSMGLQSYSTKSE